MAASSQIATSQQDGKATLAAGYGKLPLSFEANLGQADSRVRFTSHGSGYSLFLTDKGAVLALSKSAGARHALASGARETRAIGRARTDVVRMELAGAARRPQVSGEEQLPGKTNYFIGRDTAKWRSDIPTYGKVEYAGVYPGVDLVYYGNQRRLEYDFVLAPGADPQRVKLRFAGAERLKLTRGGDLTVVAKNGEIVFHKPVVYQSRSARRPGEPGARETVGGKFVLLAKSTVGFSLGRYDRGRSLVIDPTLSYSTYLGGSGDDFASGIAVDKAGNAYVTGFAGSTDFPVTQSSFQTANHGAADSSPNAFVTKLDPSGSSPIYSTYLGGSGGDAGYAIAVDGAGDAYVTGFSGSTDFPVTGDAYQTAPRSIFVTRLNASGSALVYSTFLGGSERDDSSAIAVDSAGSAYVTGGANSPDFPVTADAFQKVNKGAANYAPNAFAAKLNPEGTALVYSTYLGGSAALGGDVGSGLAVDASGSAYVAGYTGSKDFPVTVGALQTVAPNGGAFVSKLAPSGSSLIYSTYLAGSGFGDAGSGIAVDRWGEAFVAGSAGSADFPVTKGAYQSVKNSARSVAFLSELNPAGTALIYSTYLGGSVDDAASGIALDQFGNAYVTGFTISPDFPVTAGAFQTTNEAAGHSAENAFLSKLNPNGSALLYSTYLGGSGSDDGQGDYFGDDGSGIAADDSGGVYLAGHASSANFPVTKGAFQTINNGAAKSASNAFIAKFFFGEAAVGSVAATSLVSDGNPQRVGMQVTFTAQVAPTVSGAVPTGTISFSIDGGAPVKVALDDTGHASYPTAVLAEGVHRVAASYSGGGDYAPGAGASLSETIYGAPASLSSVQGHGQSSAYGTAFHNPLIVMVKDAKGDGVPGVAVAFKGAGLRFSGTEVLTDAQGEASSSATPTMAGTVTATATAIAGGAEKTETYSLNATKAPLLAAATSMEVPYGEPIPTLTYSLTGFVNGDNRLATTGSPAETTTARTGLPVGTYTIAIVQSTLAAKNYSFTFVDGSVKIMATGVVSLSAASSR